MRGILREGLAVLTCSALPPGAPKARGLQVEFLPPDAAVARKAKGQNNGMPAHTCAFVAVMRMNSHAIQAEKGMMRVGFVVGEHCTCNSVANSTRLSHL